MKKRYHVISRLLLLSSVVVGGLGLCYNTALATQTDFRMQKGAEPLSKNAEQDEKASLTGPNVIDHSKVLGGSQTAGEEPKKRTTEAFDQIYNKFALLGTVVGDKNYALAIIEDKELGRQEVYRIGRSIYGGVITDILREKVIIRLQGKDFVFKMGGGSNSGNEDVRPELNEERRLVTVSLGDMREAFGALSQPTSRARLARRSSDEETGKGGGLQLSNVQPGSVFGKMGFKEGDLIEEVNGYPIKDPYNAVAMYNLMKSVLPADILSESGLDLESFLNGTDNRMSVILQKMQKLFYLAGNKKDVQLTLTVKRNGKRQ